jgi:hypothetical protein
MTTLAVLQTRAALKALLPPPVRRLARQVSFGWQLARARARHRGALRALRGKPQLRVAFLLVHDSVWKCEQLVRLMRADGRFDPEIWVCPLKPFSGPEVHRRMALCAERFEAAGHRVLRSFDAERGGWIDLKAQRRPDLVFFTNPWAITRPEYLVDHFADTLSCYVPYGFKSSHLHHAHYDQRTHNFVWKYFLETDIHRRLARRYARNGGANAVVTGAPGMDLLLDPGYRAGEAWKPAAGRPRRLIWAPHHSIAGQGSGLDYSNFLACSEFMLDLARRHAGRIQIAFKPHPLLRGKLEQPGVWGACRTEAYYAQWHALPNGQLEESDYIDLFLGSDAMVHDSASFIVEYLYTGKPVMFVVGDDSMPQRLNEAGRIAFDAHYHGRCQADIEDFVERVVLGGDDELRVRRGAVLEQALRPPRQRSASQNIHAELCAGLFGDPL